MLTDIFIATPLVELLFRAGTTAFVVIAIALAVGQFGPIIGGALAGLPIVLGPGFYFLLGRASADFVSETAVYSVLSICATQMFTLAYIVVGSRLSPWVAVSAAGLAWFISANILRLLPANVWLGVGLFVVLTVVARWVAHRFRREVAKAKSAESIALLLLRGALAGILVAVVTAAASQLGTQWSGLLMAFPIGFTVIYVTIHRQYGRDIAISTLTSTLLGTASLVGFCGSIALTATRYSAGTAFLISLVISVLVTIGLIVRNQLKPKAVPS